MGPMMIRRASRILMFGVLASSFMLVGCTATAMQDPSPSPTITHSPTIRPETPTVTQTQTQMPTKTSTPTPTQTPPIPTPRTLTIEEARRLSLFPSAMDDCSLPCWNNLEPGKSDADEIFRFFSNMGIAIELPIIEPDDNSDLFGAGGDFMPGVNSISLDLVEVIWTEKVESIQISYFRNLDFDNKDNFLHPKNLIPTIGFPKTVSMYVQQNSYYIYIGFPDLNAGIVYQGYLSEYLTSPKLCLSRNESVGVMIRLYADTFEYIPPIGMINDYEDLASPETFTPYDEKTFLSVISDRSRCVPLQFDE